MYIPDLAEYQFLPEQPVPGVLAVGWLEEGHAFTLGAVPASALARLEYLIARVPVNLARGWHVCSLCHLGSEAIGNSHDLQDILAAVESSRTPIETPYGRVFLGAAEVWVRDRNGVVYAAPNLIHHYITQHHYKPPPAFIAALTGDDADASGWDAEAERARRVAALLSPQG